MKNIIFNSLLLSLSLAATGTTHTMYNSNSDAEHYSESSEYSTDSETNESYDDTSNDLGFGKDASNEILLFDAIKSNNIQNVEDTINKHPGIVNILWGNIQYPKTTPLLLAIENKNSIIVEYLLQHNATIIQQGCMPTTPIWHAMSVANNDKEKLPFYEIAKILLRYGDNPNIAVDTMFSFTCGITPIEFTVHDQQYFPHFKLLLAHGATVTTALIAQSRVQEFKTIMGIVKQFDSLCIDGDIKKITEFLHQQTEEFQAILAYRTNFIDMMAKNWREHDDWEHRETAYRKGSETSKMFNSLFGNTKVMAALKKYAKEFVFTKAMPKILQSESMQKNLMNLLQRGTFTRDTHDNQTVEFIFQN